MPRWRLRPLVLTLAASLSGVMTAAASTFSLSPVRIEMDLKHPTGVITLYNEGDAAVTVQVQPVRWTQVDGEDRYEPTPELLVSPPVCVLQAKGEQVVRVARRGVADATMEKSYRLFFQEVPEAAPNGFSGVKVALRIGVPVFIAPSGAKSDLSFHGRWQADGSLDLIVANHGRAHAQITNFDITSGASSILGSPPSARYFLSGTESHVLLKARPGIGRPTALRLVGDSDAGAMVADVVVDSV